MGKQTHDKILSADDNDPIESIDSRLNESYDINYKSLIGNNKLATEGFKSGNHHLETGYNLPRNRNSASRKQKEGRTKLSRMICMSLFLVLSSNITMCAENRMSMNTDTNEIMRKNVKMENSNKTGVQRLDKRHISEDKFKAFECNEETDLSTAEFSLNEPPACNRDDGSAYYPPEPKKAQILQKLQRIPVEVTIC